MVQSYTPPMVEAAGILKLLGLRITLGVSILQMTALAGQSDIMAQSYTPPTVEVTGMLRVPEPSMRFLVSILQMPILGGQ